MTLRRRMSIRMALLVAAAVLAVGPLLHVPTAHALAGARSYTNIETGDVYLGGDYIELGLSRMGSFGTTEYIEPELEEDDEVEVPKPEGFYGTDSRENIGMSTNPAGFGEEPDLRMDFFMPGTPEERWAIGYTEGENQHTASNSLLNQNDAEGDAIADNEVVNQSADNKLQAQSLGTYNNTLETKQVISFNKEDKYFKNEVTLKNIGETSISSVRYMRSFDPDNTVDQDGDFDTRNFIPYTMTAGDDISVVAANTALNDEDPVYQQTGSRSPIFFYTYDERARVSTFGFANANPYEAEAYDEALPKGTVVDDDQAITIAVDVGTLAPDASETFVYYTSLDNRNVNEVLGKTYTGPNNGDGNGDGTPDEEQPDVSHVPNTVAGSGHYLTLQTSGCGTIDSLELNDLESYGKDGDFEYPLGLVDFEVTCTDPGDTATMTFFYDEEYDTSKWHPRKYINGSFIDVPNVVFGTATVGAKTVTTMTYDVTDGGELDADGDENGAIVDPAGPAVLAASTAADSGSGAVSAPNTGIAPVNTNFIALLTIVGAGLTLFNARKITGKVSR